ncbi:MAG: zinc-binding dehydrogenase [Kofleriaceae bacterium]
MELRTGLELTSRVTTAGELQLAVIEAPVPAPGPDELVVGIQAAALNPSDLALLLGPADLSTLRADGDVTTATIPPARLVHLAARLDQAMRVGNEGAGVVVDAGTNARSLIGKTVSAAAGAMFSQFRVLKASEVVTLPEGTTAEQGASLFVNPFTTLCMLETMRREGHTAIVHTAAASNLGQMLVKLCKQDGIGLVNIVRSADHVKLLEQLGAAHVVDSTSPSFMTDLVEAIAATKATIAFDAVGGGTLASQILTAMELAANRTTTTYSRYGSSTHKQVYIYGSLDFHPTVLDRSFGLTWGVGGWLLMPALAKLGAEVARLRTRVLAELTTTFASHYTATISLRDAIRPDVILRYAKRATGEKYLVDPSRPS